MQTIQKIKRIFSDIHGGSTMWHVETDIFAMAAFVIMLLKEYSQKREKRDIQGDIFYLVLIFSIINDLIDIVSSMAMNYATSWWFYQLAMTLYVASMPLLAAVWLCYSYVLLHKGYSLKQLKRNLMYLMIPYVIYAIVAMTNPFTELFFHLTKEIEYSRGILFMPVGVGSIMVYSAAGLILVWTHRKKIEPRSNAMLLMVFFVTTAVAIWIQLANPGWLIINASYAIIYIWCDTTVEEQRRYRLYDEINKKNEELEVTAREAEAATQAKSEFLSRMSHDIRTPMNAIIGLTHLAEEEESMQMVQGYLHNIETSSNFLLGLINDILDMSKIENGELILKKKNYKKEDFINSVNTVIRPLMDEKEIDFIFRIEHSSEIIQVDPLRYNQIFFNLLSNAAKFTPKGGKVEFICEEMEPKDGKVGIRSYVRDNGIGMSEEFLSHMYDPFSQESSQMGDKEKGTGLGLPIVKSLVEMMEGTISVKSELGKETEFIVELYVPEGKAEEHQEEQESSLKSLQNARILLVEDNEINIYVAKIILENAGCQVEIAYNGKEAVERFADAKVGYYQAILMDVRMPIMNGLEATKAIRQLDKKDAATVPIIAMTADAFENEQKNTIAAGMNYHLSKPINPQLLYKVLAEHIEKYCKS